MDTEHTSIRETRLTALLDTWLLASSTEQQGRECKQMCVLSKPGEEASLAHGRVKANTVHCMLGVSWGGDTVPLGRPPQEGRGAQHPLPAEASLLTCRRPGPGPAPGCLQTTGQPPPLCCSQP